MSQVNALLSERTKKTGPSQKMAELARLSANGNRTSFAGMFSMTELSNGEKAELENLLHSYAQADNVIGDDLEMIVSITCEVKAINSQAALLHGERIKRVQEILKGYRDGAFTAWLIRVYGNRQTPYNFLQYYNFYESLPQPLRPRLEAMPRQAIYTLSSREGPLKIKQKIVENYAGESKNELLAVIRQEFPLNVNDKRRGDQAATLIKDLTKIVSHLQGLQHELTSQQKSELRRLLRQLQAAMENV